MRLLHLLHLLLLVVLGTLLASAAGAPPTWTPLTGREKSMAVAAVVTDINNAGVELCTAPGSMLAAFDVCDSLVVVVVVVCGKIKSSMLLTEGAGACRWPGPCSG
jgi:hypothetical protein